MTPCRRLACVAVAAALAIGAASAQTRSLVVDGLHVVSAAGTPVENCNALRDTLNDFTNPAEVIRLEPGKYDCGEEPLFLNGTLEGSGFWSTEITGQVKSDLVGLLNLNQLSEVRKLRISNYVSSGPANSLRVVAIQLSGNDQAFDFARIVDVRALAGSTVGGPAAAIRAERAEIKVRSSTLFGSGPGALTAEATGPGGEIEIVYSDLIPGNMTSGPVSCLYSTSLTDLLDATCSVVP